MSCTQTCNQGRRCTCKPYTLTTTSRDLPIVFVDTAYEWLKDIAYAGIGLCGVLILLAVAVAGFAYGLRAGGWL